MLKAIRHVSWRLQQDKTDQDTMMSTLIANTSSFLPNKIILGAEGAAAPLAMLKPNNFPAKSRFG